MDDPQVGYKQKFLRKKGLANNFEPSRNLDSQQLRLPFFLNFLQPSLLPSLFTTEAKEAKKSLPTSTVQTRALKANLTSQATSKLLINRSWRVNTLPVPPVPPPPTPAHHHDGEKQRRLQRRSKAATCGPLLTPSLSHTPPTVQIKSIFLSLSINKLLADFSLFDFLELIKIFFS
jgi:hypothetical protein